MNNNTKQKFTAFHFALPDGKSLLQGHINPYSLPFNYILDIMSKISLMPVEQLNRQSINN